ncbi:PDC sensor domain-containing protein [Desulfuribacillus stibiiarsenatis]|uniref:PDC sensor domain-containing protein n=1 Tax=Desulfuribacillus stibiiarsenatis TaxID=1390249 RepID=UPI003F52F08C
MGFDARLRPWYTSAVERYPDISVGLPYQDVSTEEWLVSVSLAMVDDEGQLIGVMAVDCTLEYVKSLMLQATSLTPRLITCWIKIDKFLYIRTGTFYIDPQIPLSPAYHRSFQQIQEL